MKNLRTILLITLMTPAALWAADLTGDTVALEPSMWEPILQAILSGLAIALGWLVKNAVPLLNQWLKAQLHFRGAGAVADAVCQAITHLSIEAQKRLQDGTWTAEDMAAIKAEAKLIAKAKLENLGGFYKADLLKWIDDQIEVGLSKLLLSAFGKRKDG
jgi:hypothetical protein